MKKVKALLAAAVVALTMTSCGGGVTGVIYTDIVTPVAATSNTVGTKVGSSQCVGYVGIVALGDGSIDAAAKNGNITKISHVDVQTKSYVGVYTINTYVVYGE